MKYRIDIRGVIIPNDYKMYYDWWDEDSTCPKDVSGVLNNLTDGDEVEVYINSPGGVINSGSEIYTLLRTASQNYDIKIYITGEACSAASVIACAGYCEMAPTALMMVHCVSSGISGNHNDMEHMAEVLRTADKAMCSAYVAKSGMTEEEALSMMESETWLTAEQAKEKGLIDEIMFESDEPEDLPLVAGPLFKLPSDTQMEQVKALIKAEQCAEEAHKNAELNCKKEYAELQCYDLLLNNDFFSGNAERHGENHG